MPNTRPSSLLLAICLLAPLPVALADDLPRGDTSRSVGTFVDDSVINGRVKTQLIRADGIDAGDINVDTRNGVVELKGTVADDSQMRLAEELAGKVDGVRMVDNRLSVAR